MGARKAVQGVPDPRIMFALITASAFARLCTSITHGNALSTMKTTGRYMRSRRQIGLLTDSALND
jgi:hypothetical protein